MKAVVDRIVQYANRYQLTNAETGEVLGTFDFDEVTGTVQQVGTEIDKELFDSIAVDLAARVVSAGGELAGTIVTFSDISGTAANVASGDTSATLWGKVKNWFSRLKALAFKDKISNSDVASDAAIAQSKISGLETALDAKANDADLAAIAKSGDLADATEDATHRVVTDTEKAAWNAKQNALTFDTTPTAGSTNPVTSGGVKSALDAKANDADLAAIAKSGDLADATEDATHRVVTDTEKAAWNAKQNAITGGASTIVSSNLTESRALVSDASGKVAVSDVTATELGYLDGVKSNIQEQIDDINEISATYVPWSSVDSEATANTIPQRDDNGCIDTATPVNDSNASNKGYTDSQDAVSQYNLGAFDVFTDNGDGNGDILRATYYLKIDADTSASAHMEPGRIYIPFDYQKTFVEIKGDNGAVGDIRSSQGVCTTPNNTWENYTDGISYNCTTNTLQIQISRDFEGQTLDSVETVREYFGAHPLYLQLKLNEANQYHESVILDQPINTLDQQAMWSIREEWEKRLNVLSPTYSASSRLSYSDDTFTLTSAVSGENIFRAAFPNGTYTISLMLLSKPSVNTSFSLYDGDSNDLGSYPNIQTYNLNQVYTETVTITKGLFRMTIWGAANNPTFSFKMWINKGGVSYPFTPYHTSERLYSHCITIKYGYITDASSIDVQFLTLIFTLPPITKSEAYTSIFQIKDDIVSMGFVGKCALTASGYVRGGGVYGNEKYILGVIGSTENKLIFVTQGHDEDDFDEINTSKDWDLSDINLEKLSINDIVI